MGTHSGSPSVFYPPPHDGGEEAAIFPCNRHWRLTYHRNAWRFTTTTFDSFCQFQTELSLCQHQQQIPRLNDTVLQLVNVSFSLTMIFFIPCHRADISQIMEVGTENRMPIVSFTQCCRNSVTTVSNITHHLLVHLSFIKSPVFPALPFFSHRHSFVWQSVCESHTCEITVKIYFMVFSFKIFC